jgi:hypothetical protein
LTYHIFELRQYLLHPGQRETLIELFDREFVENQEAVGMWVVGQFRDVDRPDRFVWVRGFRDMTARAQALAEFYGGPVWTQHRDAANATMIDSDDVLLLRPALPGWGFPAVERTGPPPESLVGVTLFHRPTPIDADFVQLLADQVQPALVDSGARPLACLDTEPAENTFPALPVRAGESVLAWFASFQIAAHHRTYAERLEAMPDLLARLSGPPEHLRLVPTARSALR